MLAKKPFNTAVVPMPYGLSVSGSSMEPRFNLGETVSVDPHLPAAPNTDVVLYAEIDGEARAMIKQLIKAHLD